MAKRYIWLGLGALLVSAALGISARAQEAATTSAEPALDLTLRSAAVAMPVVAADGSALETAASHMLLLDADTGTVLASKAADQKMYPSSMTKLMTLYVVFDRLKQGTLALDSQFTISEKAWRMQGSKMFVGLGSQVTLEDLIRGIAIQSGNDACIAVAEGIAGSEEAFAKLMNDMAKKIGMTGSHFVDASGWPHPDHVTTAQDLALLSAALIRDFPEHYRYLSEREFVYNGIRQFNRNLLLANPSLKVDGLKTGHTEAAGYGIALSATDLANKRRLVLIINGMDSETARAQEGERLLKWGMLNFTSGPAFKAGAEIAKAPVWMGKAREVALTIESDLVASIPKAGAGQVKATITYNAPLVAPVVKGQEVGTLQFTTLDGKKREVPLVTGGEVNSLGFFGRLARTLGL